MFKQIGKKILTILRLSKTVLHDLYFPLLFNYSLIQNCSTTDGLLK